MTRQQLEATFELSLNDKDTQCHFCAGSIGARCSHYDNNQQVRTHTTCLKKFIDQIIYDMELI